MVGQIIKKMYDMKNDKSKERYVNNNVLCENFSGNKNFMENNNTINIYQSEQGEVYKKEESLFSARFTILQKLLDDARCYGEKEYTIEYISNIVGIKNVGEMKEYAEGKKEPDEEIKQKFVEVFGVNHDWMLFNQGDYPFASNLKRYKNGVLVSRYEPMEILLNERLYEIQEFIIVIGIYDHRRSVLIIRKSSEYCYELYPGIYTLDSNVGTNGRKQLISFYRFLREADRIKKVCSIVYETTEEQFKDLYMGAVAPMIVRKYHVFKYFIDDFIELGIARVERFWDKDLIEVKKIIQQDIKNIDYINQDNDLKRIERNLEENSYIRLNDNIKKQKVFISYSWTPLKNKQWVEKLVDRLEADGIEVVIDYRDLKPGHDKYAFMEKMVSDSTIDKVLIICNSEYKKKADNREGGVGDESEIITSQVYGNVEQGKFVPIVNELDEKGNAYLPIYLASRMYVDLTDFTKGYRRLIENITNN